MLLLLLLHTGRILTEILLHTIYIINEILLSLFKNNIHVFKIKHTTFLQLYSKEKLTKKKEKKKMRKDEEDRINRTNWYKYFTSFLSRSMTSILWSEC